MDVETVIPLLVLVLGAFSLAFAIIMCMRRAWVKAIMWLLVLSNVVWIVLLFMQSLQAACLQAWFFQEKSKRVELEQKLEQMRQGKHSAGTLPAAEHQSMPEKRPATAAE